MDGNQHEFIKLLLALGWEYQDNFEARFQKTRTTTSITTVKDVLIQKNLVLQQLLFELTFVISALYLFVENKRFKHVVGSFRVNSTNGSQVSVSNIAQKIPKITLVSIMKACQILGCNSKYFWRYSLSNFLFCFAFLPSRL